jgi:23S rRNA (cytidine1920-2'-O)/16S rRNA (cytidine1409-2'-O)-methyltransferase
MVRAGERSRLDAVLVERGLASTRARAQAAILAGEVSVDGAPAAKAGQRVDAGAVIEVRPRRPRFVSRGGLKLEHALEAFAVEVQGRRVVDAGASTGGFTDCLLQRGAARVYAVDVGTGQLAWALREDPRVVVLERRNIRGLAVDAVDGPVDIVTVDLSFIGLGKVLPVLRALLRPGGTVVALVKPQFEAGPKAAPRGVVRDAAVHEAVLRRVIADAAAVGLTTVGATHSPIAGPEGNLEYFLHLEASGGPSRMPDIAAVVRTAHARVPRRGGGRPAVRTGAETGR